MSALATEATPAPAAEAAAEAAAPAAAPAMTFDQAVSKLPI